MQPSSDDVHYISGFRYPSHGGFVAYLEPFRKIADIKLGHKVVRIDPKAAPAALQERRDGRIRRPGLVDSAARS